MKGDVLSNLDTLAWIFSEYDKFKDIFTLYLRWTIWIEVFALIRCIENGTLASQHIFSIMYTMRVQGIDVQLQPAVS